MNSISNNTVRTLGLAFAALLMLALATPVKAADLGFGDTGYYFDSYTDSYPAGYDYGGGSTGYYFDSYTDSYPASYDYSSPYSSSYPFSSPSSFGSMPFGSSFPGMSGGGGFMLSNSNTNTNTNVNTNTNTCTAGSCNTAINAPTTVTVTGNNNTPSTPIYTPVYTPVYQTYQPATPYYPAPQPPVYNNTTPYVSLSAVPYTGLDLGPWGTALYWGFLIAWCLVAAYLIVVKRVQNKIVSGLNAFLFGTSHQVASQKSSEVLGSSVSASPRGQTLRQTFVQQPVAASKFNGMDPFIASQLNRLA